MAGTAVRTKHERLEPLLFRVQLLRIRGRTPRDESLEINTERDLEQVVRMFVEMDVGPVSPSSTSGYEGERSGTNHWKQTPQGTWNKSCKILHSAKDLGVGITSRIIIRSFKTTLYSVLAVLTHYLKEFNYSGYEGERQMPGITSQCEVIPLYLAPNRSELNDFHTVY